MDDLSAWNAAQNIPILYVTHSRNEVDALGERVIALDQGKVVGTGTPHEILETPRQSPLAQAAGFENLLHGTVTQLRESDGVMTVRLEGSDCEIETPLGYSKVGDKVKLAIRAGDILLATNHPQGLSARNIIPATITSLEQRGVTVVAQVLAGATSVNKASPSNPVNFASPENPPMSQSHESNQSRKSRKPQRRVLHRASNPRRPPPTATSSSPANFPSPKNPLLPHPHRLASLSSDLATHFNYSRGMSFRTRRLFQAGEEPAF